MCKLVTKFTGAYQEHPFGGDQYIFSFDNGYGASVIRTAGSYGGSKGLWELAVLKGEVITYKSGITDDVIGFLDDKEVEKVLELISQLKS